MRQCFIYERQYFMIETFNNIEHHPSILRVETTKNDSVKDHGKIKLPPFLKVLREVTHEKNYETWFMANIDYKMPESDVQEI